MAAESSGPSGPHSPNATQQEMGMVKNQLSAAMSQSHSGTNFVYAVIVLLGMIGIGRTQNNIQDKGAVQQALSKSQTAFANITQFFKGLENATQWDGKKKTAWWDLSQVEDGAMGQQFNNMINSFGQMFWNGTAGGANTDKSDKQSELELIFTVNGAMAKKLGVKPGSQIMIQPWKGGNCYVKGEVGGSWSKLAGGSPAYHFKDEYRAYLEKVEAYVYGKNTPQSEGMSDPIDSKYPPQFLIEAAANFQSQADDTPDGFNAALLSKDSDPFSAIGGKPSDDATLHSYQALYSAFNEMAKPKEFTGGGSHPISWFFLHQFQGEKGYEKPIWQIFEQMMGDWMKKKMSDSGSDAKGSPFPGKGATKLNNGQAGMPDTESVYATLDSALTTGATQMQGQTQQVAASLSQLNEELSTLMKVGQQMIQAATQASESMVQNMGKTS